MLIQPRSPESWPPRSEDLLGTGGGDVQKPPGCVGVELVLVSAERPHVQHAQHLVLPRWERCGLGMRDCREGTLGGTREWGSGR